MEEKFRKTLGGSIRIGERGFEGHYDIKLEENPLRSKSWCFVPPSKGKCMKYKKDHIVK